LVYVIVALVVAGRLGLGWRPSLALLAPLVVAEGILRWLAGRRARSFEQRLMALLQGGRAAEALELVRGERLLSFAAPRHYLLGKLAMIRQQLGQHRAAADAFRQAREEAPPRKRFALAIGLADSLYEVGEAEAAERVYRGTLDEEHASPRACANLARLILRRGGDAEEAELLLRRAVDGQRGGRLRCELALLLAARGKHEDARFELELAAEELAGASEEDARALALARARLEAAREQAPAPG
jgi:tetratricopeptide (TPR) repeat protein